MRKRRKFIIIVLTGAIAAGGYMIYKSARYQKEAVPQAVDLRMLLARNSQEINIAATQEEANQETQEEIPPELNLQMQFYPQAPFGDWDYPWQESCEEASILLVANAFQEKDWTREEFNDQILKLVEWEKKRFGSYEHTTVQQTADMIGEYLGLKTVIHDNPRYEDVQRILNKGHLIVMTFAGKRLGNPFYTNGGPNYHAMVIKGYKADGKIITEDVGTRRGEDYVYSWSTISNAMHDYADPIEAGAKRMIEVSPPENN